jgi:integrase
MTYKYVNKSIYNGKPFYYFRPRGTKPIPLGSDYGSADFAFMHAQALQAFERGAPPVRQKRVEFLPASIGWFVERWVASAEFRGKKSGTQYNYRKACDYLRDELGGGLLADMTTKLLNEYTARVQRAHGNSAADLQTRIISLLWKFALDFPEFKPRGNSNPTIDAKKRYTVKRPHQPWPQDIQDKFVAAANGPMRLAFYLLRFTAARLGDVAAMKWSDFDGATIRIRTQKTDEPVPIALPDDLLTVLAKTERVSDHILNSTWSRAYQKSSLPHRVADVMRAIGVPPRTYSAHGLRKNAAIERAHAGATVPELMASLGHRSPKMAIDYIREANKEDLAAEATRKLNEYRRKQHRAKLRAI